VSGSAADREYKVRRTLLVDETRTCEHCDKDDGTTDEEGAYPRPEKNSSRAHTHLKVVFYVLASVDSVW